MSGQTNIEKLNAAPDGLMVPDLWGDGLEELTANAIKNSKEIAAKWTNETFEYSAEGKEAFKNILWSVQPDVTVGE